MAVSELALAESVLLMAEMSIHRPPFAATMAVSVAPSSPIELQEVAKVDTTHGSLLHEAQKVLDLTRQELANLLGSSLRTVERMYAGTSSPTKDHYGILVRATFPHDPALAAKIAAFVNATPEELGIAPPAPAPSPPPIAPAPAISIHAIDSVLVAAADASDLPLSSVRLVLTTAMARARDLGLSVEALANALEPVKPAEPIPPTALASTKAP